MVKRSLAAVIALLATGWIPSTSAELIKKHALSLNDVFKFESVGRVQIAERGRLVLFDFRAASRPHADYGLDAVQATGRIYVYDRKAGGQPRALLPQLAEPSWLGSISPDGRQAAIYILDGSKVRLGVVDLQTAVLKRFPINVNYGFRASDPIWTTGFAVVVASLPNTDIPASIDFRRQAALRSNRGANAAWAGAYSGILMSSGRGRGQPQWLEGELVRVDIATGSITKLAEGRFDELVASPDAKFIVGARRGATPPISDPSVPFDFRDDVEFLLPYLIRTNGPSLSKEICHTCQLIGADDFNWSTDSSRLAFFSKPFGKTWRSKSGDWGNGSFSVFNVNQLKLTKVALAGERPVPTSSILSQTAPAQAYPVAGGVMLKLQDGTIAPPALH